MKIDAKVLPNIVNMSLKFISSTNKNAKNL